MRKRGMGRDPLSWIGEGSVRGRGEEEVEREDEGEEEGSGGKEIAAAPSAVRELEGTPVAKFATLIPVTARLSESQVEFLEAMERRIMRGRNRRHERITKNTLIRAALELLMALEWDWTDIPDEDELTRRIKQAAGVL